MPYCREVLMYTLIIRFENTSVIECIKIFLTPTTFFKNTIGWFRVCTLSIRTHRSVADQTNLEIVP